MNDIKITAYRGFSAVSGETNLTTVITNIRNGAYFHTVQKVEQHLRLGDLAKANAVKKQLPFFTLTGNYSSLRQAHSLLRYNPVITIDVDGLADDRVDAVRRLLEADADVVACFLTPKRHGFKIFLYLRTEYARRLRKTTFSVPVITYAELENHHALMYESARLYVERLIGLPVDVSGKDIPQEVAAALARRDFRQDGLDVDTAIGNAYLYVSKTCAAEKAKEEKVPAASRIMDFLALRYRFRRNTVLDRLEFCETGDTGQEDARTAPPSFSPLRLKDLNSIYVGLLTEGINCSLNTLRAIVDSDYAPLFNPFEDYLLNLPAWDGATDYIGGLADTVQTADREFWRESFRRWLVGSVACALDGKKVNQLVLILFGGQGKGKSTWISRLLPPEWSEYYHTGMISPDSKDDMLLLSTRYLINMEEFQGVRPSDLAGLKRIITQESVTLRKVYDTQAFCFARHASFIASTNKRQCLQDIDGNRRFLPSEVLSVDYGRPVNYQGVYSQAMSLLDSGFRYWYEGDEIDCLNTHNERHRMKDLVEENLFVFFRRPLPEDLSVQWMPASAILTHLTIYGKVQVNRQTQQELVQALEKYDFETRTNNQGSTEYGVVKYQSDEVERNFRQ